ncbi:MAG: hypothetical protein ACOYLS_01805 [Polymorphobacter sp.]
MRTLIVTPYHRESRAVIERCIASVAAQTVAVDHLLVADGHAADFIDALPVRHLRLDREHGDAGNTPRSAGMLIGIAEDYDAIGLLDTDNWFDADHVAACQAVAVDCDYVAARRRFVRPDGSVLPIAEDAPDRHVDTSCYLFLPGSFAVLPVWGLMPKPVSPIGDWVFHAAAQARGLRRAATDRATVNYTVTVRYFYDRLGETPPPEAKDGADYAAIRGWTEGLDAAGRAALRARLGFDLHWRELTGPLTVVPGCRPAAGPPPRSARPAPTRSR